MAVRITISFSLITFEPKIINQAELQIGTCLMDHPYLGTQHLACVFSALQGKEVQQSALAGNPNAGSQLSIPHLRFVPQVLSLAHHPSPTSTQCGNFRIFL